MTQQIDEIFKDIEWEVEDIGGDILIKKNQLRKILEKHLNPSSKEECRCHIKGAYCQIHQKYIQISEPTKEAINMTKDISGFDEPVEKKELRLEPMHRCGKVGETIVDIETVVRNMEKMCNFINNI